MILSFQNDIPYLPNNNNISILSQQKARRKTWSPTLSAHVTVFLASVRSTKHPGYPELKNLFEKFSKPVIYTPACKQVHPEDKVN